MKKTILLIFIVGIFLGSCCSKHSDNKEDMQNKDTIVKEITKAVIEGKFQQEDLNFKYNELEPFLDARTMEIHYSKHHVGYIKKLNKAIVGTEAESMSLLEILQNVSKFSDGVRNNSGGHFNHSLFWSILSPKKDTKPSAKLIEAINEPRETYFEITTTVINIIKTIVNGKGNKPQNTPADVATPFPPLNPAKIVHIWPVTAPIAAII